MIKAIIFDMDGTLTDSEPAITQACIEVIHGLGYEAYKEDFKQFTGMGDDLFLGGVLELHGGKYIPEYKDEAYRIYMDTAKERVKVYRWSKQIITELHRKGYKLAVASASDSKKVRCNIDCIGVDASMFSAIITGSDVERKKPAPDIFLKAAEKIGVEPECCLIAEDAVSGIMAAKAAGMIGVAVTTSFAEDRLYAAGADKVTDDLSCLPEIVESFNR